MTVPNVVIVDQSYSRKSGDVPIALSSYNLPTTMTTGTYVADILNVRKGLVPTAHPFFSYTVGGSEATGWTLLIGPIPPASPTTARILAGGQLASFALFPSAVLTLGNLSLSGTLTNGVSTSGAILGATPGSTITTSVTGLTVDSINRTYTFNGSGSAATITNGLVETLAGAANSPKNNSVTIVSGSATLGTLSFGSLPTPLYVGSSASGSIVGATGGSTITASGLPTGFTINGAARTWAWDGTGSVSTPSVTLTETLAGASNTPHSTVIGLTIASGAGSPSYIGPTLTAQASPTSYPPQPLLTTNAYHPVGAKLHVRAAATYANVVAGTSLLVDDATFTLTANPTTNQNGLWSKLSSISSGKTFIAVRVEESGGAFSEWSNYVMHGSSSVPAPQASINFSVYSTFPLSGAITFAEPVYLTILGDDQISFELVGAQPGTSFTLRWLDNIAKNYDPTQTNGNNDFNVDHVYDYILRRRSLADVSADSTGAVTLLDYDTTPDAFSFTPVTGATQSSLVALDSTVFSGMAAGYGAPLTLSGAWEKFKVDQGSGFGADQTSTSGVTLQDGWGLRVYVRASSSYLTLARATATVGGVSANADVTTMADPTAASMTPASPASFHNQFSFGGGTTISLGSVTFGAGYPIVVLCDGVPRTHTGVTLNGVAATQIANPGNGISVWKGSTTVAAGTVIPVVATFDTAPAAVLAQFFTGISTVSLVSGSIQSNTRGYGHDHNSDSTFSEGVSSTLTVASGNVGFMAAYLTSQATAAWNGATAFSQTVEPNSGSNGDNLMTAAVTSTGTPYVDFNITGDYPYSCYLAFVWSKT